MTFIWIPKTEIQTDTKPMHIYIAACDGSSMHWIMYKLACADVHCAGRGL